MDQARLCEWHRIAYLTASSFEPLRSNPGDELSSKGDVDVHVVELGEWGVGEDSPDLVHENSRLATWMKRSD